MLSRCQQNEIIKWGAEAPVNEDVGVFIVTTRKRPSARSTLMAFASDSHVTNSEFIIPTQGMFSFGLFFRSPPSPPLSASLCCSLLPRPSYGATCRQQRQPYGTGCRRRRQSWTGVGRYGQDPRRPHNIVWPDPTGSVAPLTLFDNGQGSFRSAQVAGQSTKDLRSYEEILGGSREIHPLRSCEGLSDLIL